LAQAVGASVSKTGYRRPQCCAVDLYADIVDLYADLVERADAGAYAFDLYCAILRGFMSSRGPRQLSHAVQKEYQARPSMRRPIRKIGRIPDVRPFPPA
jgi:hypothetical protein